MSVEDQTDEEFIELEDTDEELDLDAAGTDDSDDDEGEDELVIEIEGEADEEETPLIKEMRAKLRDRDRELATYRKAAQPQRIVVGEKPQWTDSDIDYDEDKMEAALLAWNARKDAAAKQEADEQRQIEVNNQEWARVQQNYQLKAQRLQVKDFEEAENTLKTALPEILQSALLMYTQDPAKVGYALYKYPAKLAKLAEETDPIKFVLAVNELERNLKVNVGKRKPPSPESDTIQRGSASASTGKLDKQLEALEKKAAKTGDRSEIVRYKASLRK